MIHGSKEGRVLVSAVALTATLCGAAWGEAAERGDEGGREHRIVVLEGENGSREERVHEIVLADGPEGAMRFLGGAGHLVHPSWAGGGFLGVELTSLTGELRAHFGAPEDAGVMVARVVEDSPAWRAGVRVGDIVVAVAGERVDTPADLAREVRERGDETVTVELWRDGRLEQLDVALEEREASWRGFEGFELPPCAAAGDCAFDRFLHWRGLDCEREDCNVVVRCDGAGQCECEVDGESRDCAELEGEGE